MHQPVHQSINQWSMTVSIIKQSNQSISQSVHQCQSTNQTIIQSVFNECMKQSSNHQCINRLVHHKSINHPINSCIKQSTVLSRHVSILQSIKQAGNNQCMYQAINKPLHQSISPSSSNQQTITSSINQFTIKPSTNHQSELYSPSAAFSISL